MGKGVLILSLIGISAATWAGVAEYRFWDANKDLAAAYALKNRILVERDTLAEETRALKSQLAEAGDAAKSAGSKAERLSADLTEAKAKIRELKRPPETIAQEARLAIEREDLVSARSLTSEAVKRGLPKEQARRLDESIQAAIRDQKKREEQAEAERKADERRRAREIAAGWKIFKSRRRMTLGDLTIQVKSSKRARNWIVDRYSGRYHYKEAIKGQEHLIIDVTLTTKDSAPDLPGISIYRRVGDQLVHQSRMGLEFYRWSDYGSYLGNYHDSRNDFAHRNSIPFTYGAQVPKDGARYYALVTGGCMALRHKRFKNPPYWYEDRCQPPSTISIEEARRLKDRVLLARK